MKNILNLPLNVVKTIIALAALSSGVLVVIVGLIVYTNLKTLFHKKKDSASEA